MNTKFSIGQIVYIIVANNFPTPMRNVQISASTKMYTLKFIEGEKKVAELDYEKIIFSQQNKKLLTL